MMTKFDGHGLSLFSAVGLTVLSVAAAPGAARAGGMAEPIVQVTMNDYMEDLCARTDLTRADLRGLRNSANFGEILAYTLEHCPELAALLSDQATATIPAAGNAKDDDRRRTRSTPGDGGEGGGDGDGDGNGGDGDGDGGDGDGDGGEGDGDGDAGDGDGDGGEGDGDGGDGDGDGDGGGKKDGPGKRTDGPGKREDGPGRRNRGQDGAAGETAGESETNQGGGN